MKRQADNISILLKFHLSLLSLSWINSAVTCFRSSFSNLSLKFVLLFLSFILVYSQTYSQNIDVANLFRLGQSYENAGNMQKAKETYEKLLEIQPDNYVFFDALNRVYVQLKDYDNSIALIEQRLKLNPDDVNMKGLLGSTYYLKGDEEKAFKTWDDALDQSPQNVSSYRVIANYAIERRVFNKAIEYLTLGKKLSDDNSYLSFELANLDVLLMRYKDAAEEYCSVLLKQPKQLNNVQNKISTYINKSEAVDPTLETVEKWADDNDDLNFKILLAWLYVQTGQYDKAYDEYLKVEDQHKAGGSDLYGFAQQAFSEKHYEIASKAYKKIIDNYPNSTLVLNSKIGFAKTFEAMLDKKYYSDEDDWKPFSKPEAKSIDDYNQAISAYLQLVQNNKNMEIELESYYRIGLIEKQKYLDLTEAEKYFKKVISISLLSKLTIFSYKELADIEIDRNNLDSARDYYNKIISAPRPAADDRNFALLMEAKIDFWQGNFPAASKLLNNVVRNLSDDNTNNAIELSLIINTTKNDSLSLLQFAKAELLVQQGKYKEAKDTYSMLSKNQNLLTLRDLSSFRDAEMLIAMNKLPEAITQLKDISDQKEKNIYSDRALFLLGKVYQFGIRDYANAQQSYENLLANFPNSLYLDDARENINLLKNKMKKSL